MGWRFRKSFSPFKGLRINLGKRGVGASIGVPGARIGVGSRGVYTSAGIPGTGLYRVDYHTAHSQTVEGAGSDQAPRRVDPRKVAIGCITIPFLFVAGCAVLVLATSGTKKDASPSRSTSGAEVEANVPAPAKPALLAVGQLYRTSQRVPFFTQAPPFDRSAAIKTAIMIPAYGYFQCSSVPSSPDGIRFYGAEQ